MGEGGEGKGETPTSVLVGVEVPGRNKTLNFAPRVQKLSFWAAKGGGGGGLWEVFGVGVVVGGEEGSETPTSVLVGVEVSGKNKTLNFAPRVQSLSFWAEKGGGGGCVEGVCLGVGGRCLEGETPISVLVGVEVSGRNYTLNFVPRV